ncbi:MAG: AbgT family transporter [Planctomycetes bacterium]|nr:AbgT family transporter [Planctomycetota bacterium]
MSSGFLGAIEKVGNRLPDPVVIFVWMIVALFGWLGLRSQSRRFFIGKR